MPYISAHRSHSSGIGLSFLSFEKIILDPELTYIEDEGNDHHDNDQLDVWVRVRPIKQDTRYPLELSLAEGLDLEQEYFDGKSYCEPDEQLPKPNHYTQLMLIALVCWVLRNQLEVGTVLRFDVNSEVQNLTGEKRDLLRAHSTLL